MSKELALQAAGWMYSRACRLADEGIDIRKVEVPELIAELEQDLPEVRYEPAPAPDKRSPDDE